MLYIHLPAGSQVPRWALLVCWLCIVFQVPATHAAAWQADAGTTGPDPINKRKIFGTVVEQRKYSLRVASGEEDIEIAVPDKVAIDQRLDKPRLDLASKTLFQELLGSQEPGTGIPAEVEEALPSQLGLVVEFAHANERRRVMSENPKKLARYRLVPQELLPRDPENDLILAAKVISSDERGQLFLQTEKEDLTAELGNRDGRLGARTIADLRPLESEVEIQADWVDGKWVAQSIVFRRVKLLSKKTAEAPPRMLILGDEVSLSYLHNLRKKFEGAYQIHHPPENCRGSANWERLAMWLGPYRQPGYEWDVIVFNLGLGDLNTESVAYRDALKQAIPLLRSTGAKLVWLSTTPLPSGWQANPTNTGRKMSRAEAQAKIKELNTLAAEELKGAGGVQLIDLTNPIESELESRFANWSTGRSPMLNREQSDLVAEKLAETLGVALPKYEDE